MTIMKKQIIGEVCKRARRLTNTLWLPAFVLTLLCSCDEDKAKSDWPNENELLQEITPVLAPQGSDFEGVEKYGVYLYLFNEMSSECYKYQSADAFGLLKPVVVERAAYSLVSLMMNPQSANVSFEASMKAHKSDEISVVDMNQEIPDLVLASATVSQKVETPVQLTTMQRMVGALNVKVTDVPQEVTAIEVTVNGLYDQFNFNGIYGFSADEGASKTFALKKTAATNSATKAAGGSLFSNQVVVLPSDTDLEQLKMSFRVYKGADYEVFNTRFSGAILANKVAVLEGTADELLKNAILTTGFTYAPWDSRKNIEDNITIGTDPSKKWSSKSLKIGGGSSYNNFWASSSYAGSFDSYLYDGVKGENPDQFWGPDLSWDPIPTWYLDLGAAYEGVTIDYWNKFGGKGGGKIKTLDIFVSNNADDYGGGAKAWVKIYTFTSDRTAGGSNSPDAGAHLTTGRVAFSQNGTNSYRYVKCEVASRVSPDGVADDSLDANVAEVEIQVWNCQ